jgi:outer membrane protein
MRRTVLVSLFALLMALPAVPAFAGDHGIKQAGDWLVRGRATAVVPGDGGDIFTNPGGADTGLDITDITTTFIPELDITYFWTKNIATELVLGTTPHDVEATGGIDVGTVWLLPPTITVQYHPMPESKFSPYIGAGINYTFFYGEGGGLPGFDVKNELGWALQAGIDYQLKGPWSLNLDVKKIFLRPEATTSTLRVDEVEIDPWLISVGLGYRF